MGKLAQRPVPRPHSLERQRLQRLRDDRRKAVLRLQRLDAKLAKLVPSHRAEHPPTPRQLDRWFAALSEGFPTLPSLPSDFSRADLYDDHD